MFLVAHTAADKAAHRTLTAMLDEERRKRIQAQRAAWRAEQALAEERERHRNEAAQRTEAMAMELREAGHRYRHTYRSIERRACRLFKVSSTDLHSQRRNRRVFFVRHFIMYWAVRLTKLSLPQIGRLMGNRDHTTVLHGSNVYPDKRSEMGRHLRRVR